MAYFYDLAASTIGAAVAVDGGGNLYAASCATNSVAVYSAHAGTAPIRFLAGPKTQLACPRSVASDADGDLFVLEIDPDVTEQHESGL